MNRTRTVILLVSLLALLAGGCGRADSAAPGQTAAPLVAAPTKAASGKVARVVFVDLERCCSCTRTRIDNTWKALMEVLGFPPNLPLDRFHMDTQAEKAAPYRAKKAVMVPPAIYFLDGKDVLLEMLQGEVTAAQIKKALQ